MLLCEWNVLKFDQEIAYLMYNDKPPNSEESMNHGHSKGELTQD